MANTQGNNEFKKEEKWLTAIKMGLEVLIFIAIIGAVVSVYQASKALYNKKPDESQNELIWDLVTRILGLIFGILLLYGVIKESKCNIFIVLVVLVCMAFNDGVTKNYESLVVEIIIIVLTTILLVLVYRKQKRMAASNPA